MEYESELEFAVSLARECGEITKKYFMASYNVDYKDDGSPVTIADQSCERLMRQRIGAKYPQHNIIGEEEGSSTSQGRSEYTWVLDPIDGTKSFITGVPLYSILIGLLHHDSPVLGLAYFPVLDELITAIDLGSECKTWWNSTVASVRPGAEQLSQAWIMTSNWASVQQINPDFCQRMLGETAFAGTWGDAYAYNLLASGRCDIAFDLNMHIWDLVPIVPILRGSGALMCDAQGRELLADGIDAGLNYSCIAATNELLLKKMMA